MEEGDTIVLTSVGVDIGSSTSHLLFSRLELERQDSRYVTTKREVLYQSDILLTPYTSGSTIDQQALAAFIHQQYAVAGIEREAVDTGALILTGVALLRDNARAIAEIFAAEAGKFVAVSAGDNLEATMAAYGGGAVQRSRQHGPTMHIDIGGGTTKVVVCRDGRTPELMAVDVGARLIAYDAEGRVNRLEPTGKAIAERLGVDASAGSVIAESDLRRIAQRLADELLCTLRGEHSPLLRTAPLRDIRDIRAITFSGGVSEFIYGRADKTFGDLGAILAEEILSRVQSLGVPIEPTPGGIRATVIGASQYTIQVSGSTIYLSPLDVVPLRNVPVVMPTFRWDDLSTDNVRQSIEDAKRRFDLLETHGPVAIAVAWQGSATFNRIDAFCSGALQAGVAPGQPLVFAFDGDIGGLLGLHVREELQREVPIVSIDGLELSDFDFIDIGALIPSSGAVPVVIKSLIFPTH